LVNRRQNADTQIHRTSYPCQPPSPARRLNQKISLLGILAQFMAVEKRCNLYHLRTGHPAEHLDAFLHRDWIRRFARGAGFGAPRFTDGQDGTDHLPF
jgi:hypothetical protein